MTTIKNLRVALLRVEYGTHIRQRDCAAVAALLRTLAEPRLKAAQADLDACVSWGRNLQEQLWIMRQWAIKYHHNRLRGDVEAVLNVMEAYRLGWSDKGTG